MTTEEVQALLSLANELERADLGTQRGLSILSDLQDAAFPVIGQLCSEWLQMKEANEKIESYAAAMKEAYLNECHEHKYTQELLAEVTK